MNEKDFAARFCRDFETFEVGFPPFQSQTESMFQTRSLIFFFTSCLGRGRGRVV